MTTQEGTPTESIVGDLGDATLPDSGDRPMVVLVDAPSMIERRLVERWVADTVGTPTDEDRRPGVDVVPTESEELAARITRGDNPLLVPVRITWGERELGGRLLRLADAVTRRSWWRTRARVARPGGAPHHIIVGRPATVRELRRRHQAERTSTDPADLVQYVSRQATLTLDRAERALFGNRFKVPREVADQIVGSGSFLRITQRLAARLGRTPEDVAHEAADDLAELVASLDPSAVETFSAILRPMHAKAWEVHADLSGLAPLRTLGAQHALVFLPAHRSYTDPFVLADVLHNADFPRNHVLGGNNLRILGLESLARRSGIIFIRRSFGKDLVYKAMVREYFQWLCAKRFNLEWYMEGGRSRTGKLRPPKYGLLSDVASAVETGRAADVYLVPVSITHDQLQEVHQMAAEQTGTAKTPEGLRWLANYARAQRRPVGGVHVAFGTPLSLRAALAAAGDQAMAADHGATVADHPAESADVPEIADDTPERRLALQKTAFEVFVGINRVTPVTPIALATLTLLGVRDRALTLSQVRRVVEPVLDYVDARGLPHTGVEALRTNGGVAETLLALRKEKVVSAYTEGTEPVFSVEPGHHIVAAFYRNSAIHHFVDRAIIELAILEVGDATGRDGMERGFAAAMALRDLLKFEFFFPDRTTFRHDLIAELTLIDPDWRRHDDDVPRTQKLLTQHRFLCAHRVLRSFVDAQWVVADRLRALGDRVTDTDALLERSAAVGQQMLLQGTLHGAESLSYELFSSAIALADNRTLLGEHGTDDPTLADRRRAFAAEVRSVVERIVTIDEIDATNRQETTGVRP